MKEKEVFKQFHEICAKIEEEIDKNSYLQMRVDGYEIEHETVAKLLNNPTITNEQKIESLKNYFC